MRVLVSLFAIAVAGVVASAPARAGLLTGHEAQLEAWLGEGDLDFTLLYEQLPGHNGFDFHAAADGQGRTFSLILAQPLDTYFGNPIGAAQIIGGYNPQSWSSIGDWNYTNDDADRTAFVFNLESDVINRQKLSSDASGYGNVGHYQTQNHASYGPAFGGGHDLFVDINNGGVGFSYSQGYTYGSDVPGGVNILGGSGVLYFSSLAVETYAFAPADVSAVPEPASATLFGIGALGLGLRSLRRRLANLAGA